MHGGRVAKRGDSATALSFTLPKQQTVFPRRVAASPSRESPSFLLTLSGVQKQQQQLLCSLQRQGRIQMRAVKGSRERPSAALEKASGAAASTDANVAQPSRARCHQKARERAPCRIAFSIHVRASS